MRLIISKWRTLFGITLMVISGTSALFAAESNSKDALSTFKNYCGDCHIGKNSKGQFDLSKLNADIDTPQSISRWERILIRVETGEMPPPGEARPPVNEINEALNRVKANLAVELQTRRGKEGRTQMRRLNRVEYENTLRNLLGIQTYLQEVLPPDGTANGFDTASSALRISPVHIAQYMDAANLALKASLIRTTQPQKKISRLFFVPEKEQTFMEYAGNKSRHPD